MIALLDEHLDEIYTDRTSHELQLQRMLPQLDAAFSATHSATEIRECADRRPAKFEEASVRSHVLTFAHRNTADCLRSGGC